MTKDCPADVIESRETATCLERRRRATAGASSEYREDLLEAYLPLVKTVVARFKMSVPAHVDLEDLHSVGVTGLIAALRNYDEASQSSFRAYALTRIRGAILDELRRMDWMTRSARTNSKKLRVVIDALEQRLRRPATEEEIRHELGLDEEQYQRLLDEVRPISFIPLENQLGGEETDGINLAEVIPDDAAPSATENLERRELIELVAARINQLAELPRKLLAMYYYEGLRMSEIAEVFGLTESRICQIHTQAVLGLRVYLTQAMRR